MPPNTPPTLRSGPDESQAGRPEHHLGYIAELILLNRNLVSGLLAALGLVALNATGSYLQNTRESGARSVRENELATVLALTREGFSNLDVMCDSTGKYHFVIEGTPYSIMGRAGVETVLKSDDKPTQCIAIDGLPATPVKKGNCPPVQ